MTPAARIQALIDLRQSWQERTRTSLDKLIAQYTQSRRYIGGSDRRYLHNSLHHLIRHHARLTWWCDEWDQMPHARLYVIGFLVLVEGMPVKELMKVFQSSSSYGPEPLGQDEKEFMEKIKDQNIDSSHQPPWVQYEVPAFIYQAFEKHFPHTFQKEMKALNQTASLDIRINTLKSNKKKMISLLKKEKMDFQSLPSPLYGLRLKTGTPLSQHHIYRSGLVEVQDAGSQLCSYLVQAQPHHRVLDFCAGAGGKTLALAAQMNNGGKILACDVDPDRLDQARKRCQRAHVKNTTFRLIHDERDTWLKSKSGFFDRVVVDAPCSGSGTWRRQPSLRWRITPDDIKKHAQKQLQILKAACQRVTWSGRLIYITCSLFEEENENVIEQFLKAKKDFSPIHVQSIHAQLDSQSPYATLTPYRHESDGFFIAIMEKVSQKKPFPTKDN